MKKKFALAALIVAAVMALVAWAPFQGPSDPLIAGFVNTEVASISDAMEQLYGIKNFMSHDMRPLFPTRFAGPAWTVYMKKEENKEGGAAVQGMLDAIDSAPAGAVYVMVIQDGLDVAGVGGLMATTMKVRGLAGAVVDASMRDTPQMRRIQFPVFARGIVPSTTVGHWRFVGNNIPVTCAGVKVNPGDIIVADEDGVVSVPKDKAQEVLKKAQQLDLAEHQTYPLIEKLKSVVEAVKQMGRI